MNTLNLYVIYENPKDFPGKFVVRRHAVMAGQSVPDKQGIVCNTLKEARSMVPSGLVNLHRFPEDDPVIKEVWV